MHWATAANWMPARRAGIFRLMARPAWRLDGTAVFWGEFLCEFLGAASEALGGRPQPRAMKLGRIPSLAVTALALASAAARPLSAGRLARQLLPPPWSGACFLLLPTETRLASGEVRGWRGESNSRRSGLAPLQTPLRLQRPSAEKRSSPLRGFGFLVDPQLAADDVEHERM